LIQIPTILEHVEHLSGIITFPRPVPLLRKLLERGLDPNRSDWLGKTFLHACAENGDRSAAALFLDAGADINSREVEFCGTPLAAAVRSCHKGEPAERQLKMVRFLLQCGAATNLPGDKTWATPLAWARKGGLKDIEQMLLKHGAH
jgi:ankyrin repeat protein